MKNSFFDLMETESNQEAEAAQEEVIENAAAEENEQQEEVEEQEEEEEEEESQELSEETKKKISGQDSFFDTLEEAQKKKREEAEEAEQEEEEEQEQEEEEEEEEDAPEPPKFKVGEQEFESIDAVNAHLEAQQEEFTSLQKEVDEIRGFVEKVSDPEMIEVLKYVAEGHSFRVAMVKAGFDESMFEITDENEPDAKELVRAQIAREEAKKEEAKRQETLQANMQSTNSNLTELQTEEGFDDKVKNQLIKAMADFQSNGFNGLVSKENMKIFLRGINYTKAVQDAEERGELKGKNTKIVIEKKKRQGDSLPQLGRGITAEKAKPKGKNLSDLVAVQPNSFFDLL